MRVWLEQQDLAYVLATRRNDTLITGLFTEARADDLVAALPVRAWQRTPPVPVRTGRATTSGRGSRSVSAGNPAASTGYWHDAR
ncbi:hypothetical protein ACW9HJ_35085 [Nocardia gipuzkoensis]